MTDNLALPTLYTPSGRFTPASLVAVPALGGIAAALAGIVYGYLIELNPFAYFNVLATWGFGVGAGFIAGRIGHATKLRNPLLALVLGVPVGLAGWYASWVAWVHALLEEVPWFFAPGDLWLVIQSIAENGAWRIRSFTPTGGVLYAIWAVEAVVIVGFAAYASRSAAAEPFCEGCARWATPVFKEVSFAAPGSPDELAGELLRGNVTALGGLAEAGAQHYTSARLHTCPQCRARGYFSVEDVVVERDRRGKESKKRKRIVANLEVRGTTLAVLRELAKARAPAANTETAAAS